MIGIRVLRIGLGLLLLGGSMSVGRIWRAQAQGADRAHLLSARFEEARALAADPQGRLYVADAGRDVVDVFGSDGTRRAVLGGGGTRAGALDTPSDVDPTNGQLVLVADTYNGRIQRFSEEGQYLESLPVERFGRRAEAEWTFQGGQSGAPVRGDGRPIGVARGDEGAVFVLDARDRRLWTWSDLGRLESLVSEGDGRLRDPVALAVGPGRRVYVADAGREVVLVYDAFGTFRRRVPVPARSAVQALVVHRGQLWVVCAERVLVWDRADGIVGEHTVDLSESLVDVAVHGKEVYLLTETRLLRRPAW